MTDLYDILRRIDHDVWNIMVQILREERDAEREVYANVLIPAVAWMSTQRLSEPVPDSYVAPIFWGAVETGHLTVDNEGRVQIHE